MARSVASRRSDVTGARVVAKALPGAAKSRAVSVTVRAADDAKDPLLVRAAKGLLVERPRLDDASGWSLHEGVPRPR